MCVNYSEIYVATEFPGVDPFGLFNWLQEPHHQVSVELFASQDGVFVPQYHRHKVPDNFYSAYDLVISGLYRRNAASITKSILSDISRLQDDLTSLITTLEQLSAALAPETTNYCPF